MSRSPWTMKIGFDPYFLEWLGRTFGKDQEDYLVCDDCDARYEFGPDIDKCPHCGGEIVVHVPDSEMMVIRWRVWKGNQKWWPQRYYVWPSLDERGEREEKYRYWAFLGREWFKRPDKSDWFGVDE